MSTKRSLASLAEQFAKKTNEGSGNGDQSWKLFFNFWKADNDTVSVVRFLPDADETNPMVFLVENLSHELVVNGRREKVPCLKMYGEDCPICELSQSFYDKKSPDFDEARGKKYYRKKSYIGQILVISTPLEHDQEQLVKLIEFGPAVFKQIQAAFQSGDLEESPCEFKGGYHFRIKKTKSGEYASYTTSSFAPKQSDIDDDVIESLELFNLGEYRTARKTAQELEAMLAADQTGGTVQEAKPDAGLTLKKKAKPATVDADDAGVEPAETKTETAGAGEKQMSVVERLRAKAAAAKQANAE